MPPVLAKFKSDIIKAARAGLKESATLLENKIIERATLTDHTLKDLVKLGFPYSAQHPKPPLHDPNWQIHIQSGTLQDNIRQTAEGKDAISVGVDGEKVIDDEGYPYLDDVINGTPLMIPRPFVTESYNESTDQIKETMDDYIKTACD